MLLASATAGSVLVFPRLSTQSVMPSTGPLPGSPAASSTAEKATRKEQHSCGAAQGRRVGMNRFASCFRGVRTGNHKCNITLLVRCAHRVGAGCSAGGEDPGDRGGRLGQRSGFVVRAALAGLCGHLQHDGAQRADCGGHRFTLRLPICRPCGGGGPPARPRQDAAEHLAERRGPAAAIQDRQLSAARRVSDQGHGQELAAALRGEKGEKCQIADRERCCSGGNADKTTIRLHFMLLHIDPLQNCLRLHDLTMTRERHKRTVLTSMTSGRAV